MQSDGKLKNHHAEFPYICDICNKKRAQGNHQRCSRIRQQKHADLIRDDDADRALMFDKKE